MLSASIVLYHNSEEEVQNVLHCALLSPIDIIYVIDNSRNDLLRLYCQGISERVVYVHSENIGYGGAHNVAIKDAMRKGAVYHIVLNPDIYFEPDVIEKLTAYMDEHPEAGQVMPKVFYPDGRLQYLCKLVPTPLDLIFKRFLPAFLVRKRMYRFQLRFTGYDKFMNVPYLSGCFMFFRVAALQQVGLFDERFFMYPEDIDITRRMHEKYKTVFIPDVSIIHAHAAASRTNTRMLKIHISNMIKYFNKWGWFFDAERRKINKKVLRELKCYE